MLVTQTPAQLAAAESAAGLSSAQKAGVAAGTGYTPSNPSLSYYSGGGSNQGPVTPPAPVPTPIPTPSPAAPTTYKVTTGSGTSLYYNPTTGQYYSDSGGANKVTFDSNSGAISNVDGTPFNANATPQAEATNESNVEANILNPTPPRSEDQIYQDLLGQSSNLLSTIQQEFDAATTSVVTADTQAGNIAMQNTNAASAASGLLGSSAAAGNAAMTGANTAANITKDTAAITAQRAQAVAGILQNLTSLAQSQSNTEATRYDTESQNALSLSGQLKQQTLQSIQGLASHGINWQTFSTDPTYTDAYNHLVQTFGANEAQGMFMMSTPAANIIQSQISPDGSTYYQVSQVPGSAPQMTSYKLPSAIPPGWTSVKIGTTGVMFYNPADPSQNITYTTNPFTGEITPGGSATAPDTSTQNTTTTSLGTNGNTGASTASTTVSSILGVDPTTSLSDVVQNSGIGAIVAALVKNEGGSPTGVKNNPGNVKYTGADGQTDSGVKATDGGTFASYATPQAGESAIASLVQGAASGTISDYGTNPTVQDFVNKYTGNASTSQNGLDPAEYGKLASVPGFDPSKPGLDQAAFNWIKSYLSTGAIPTSSRSMTLYGTIQEVQSRAQDAYFKATGQNLPNATTLKTNLGLVSNNNQLLNNLSIQEGTISKNFGLNLENLNANNVNQAAPVINKLVDAVAQAAGNTSVAQYLSQNKTIQQELGSLLAVKNASGTTVADKLAAGDLLPSDLSADQQKIILQTLIKEANNQKQVIGQTNEGIYQKTDPLGLDPQNPANQPGYQQFTSIGFTNNYDGTWSAPDGTTYTTDASGNPTQTQ